MIKVFKYFGYLELIEGFDGLKDYGKIFEYV